MSRKISSNTFLINFDQQFLNTTCDCAIAAELILTRIIYIYIYIYIYYRPSIKTDQVFFIKKQDFRIFTMTVYNQKIYY